MTKNDGFNWILHYLDLEWSISSHPKIIKKLG